MGEMEELRKEADNLKDQITVSSPSLITLHYKRKVIVYSYCMYSE